MNDQKREDVAKGNWVVSALFMLALGSLGPANIYMLATDATYLDRFEGWKILMLPFGAWLLTGFLLQGLTITWAGITRQQNWSQRGEKAWEWWLKLGLWLVGLGVALVIAILAFSGLADYLSSLDKGALLIAGLLFMILLALWRIGDQMKRGQ